MNAIEVFAKPKVDFYSHPQLITFDEATNVLIKNGTVGGNTYNWWVKDDFYSDDYNIRYSFSDTGCVSFKLVASNELGCVDSLRKDICVIDGFTFWVPASFTPNNDGLNDVFIPVGVGYVNEEYLFEVYNRWGDRIFRTQDMNTGWDGKLKGDVVELGQYMWYATVRDKLGVIHHIKGFVDVLK